MNRIFHLFFLLGLMVSTVFSQNSLTNCTAVPTFHSIGVYCTYTSGTKFSFQYRQQVQNPPLPWSSAHPLSIDASSNQVRGSIVNLSPGTAYDVKIFNTDTWDDTTIQATTWSETFPVASVINVGSPGILYANQSGTVNGYTLYTPSAGGGTINGNGAAHCVEISGSYIIVRGLNLSNALYPIIIKSGASNIIIENCTITDWGAAGNAGVGNAIHTEYSTGKVIIQNNTIYNPKGNSTTSESGSPVGPSAISFHTSTGNNVIRYNTIYSQVNNYYADIIDDFADQPNNFYRDTDIYGNQLSHCFGKGIDLNGENANCRIWNNVFHHCYTAAYSNTSVGPIYFWRNIILEGYQTASNVGSATAFLTEGTGFQYYYHNSLTVPSVIGVARGIYSSGTSTNVTAKNNILDCGTPVNLTNVATNLLDYNLYSTTPSLPTGSGTNKIVGEPEYDKKSDYFYALKTTSPGYEAGVTITNFSGSFRGAQPEIGALESGGTAADTFHYGAGILEDIAFNGNYKALSVLGIQSYPNPFTSSIHFTPTFTVSGLETMRMNIYNPAGQLINTVPFNGVDFLWDGRNSAGLAIPSGQYIVSIETGNKTLSKKILKVQ